METTKQIPEVIAALKQEAEKNEEFNAVMFVLAHRERARRNLDINALRRTMEAQGADFKRETYEHVIQFLGKLGLGTVKKSPTGKIRALTNITTTLQSIGMAAAGKSKGLESFKPKQPNRYKKLPVEIQPVEDTHQYSVALTVIIDGNPIVLHGPSNLKPEDLGAFLANFSNLTKGYGGRGNA